jgi:hypothetical protein
MQNHNSLARQVAMAQGGRNGVRVMGRQSNPVSVGACGSPWDATAGYGTGQYGLQYGVNQNFYPSLPQNAPNAGAFLVNPNQVLQQNYSPLGLRFQAVAGQTTNVELAPTHGLYYIAGIRTFVQPDVIFIERVSTGGADLARNAGPFDAASYNTVECFCPVDWGCISSQQPMQIAFSAVGTPSVQPFLNLSLFGTQQQSFNSCYPGLPAAIGLAPGAAGNWAM